MTQACRGLCPIALEEGASLGGAWHPDSPMCVDVFVNFRRIGVPGILDGERSEGQGATKALRSMIELRFSSSPAPGGWGTSQLSTFGFLHGAHLPMALPVVATPDTVLDPTTTSEA